MVCLGASDGVDDGELDGLLDGAYDGVDDGELDGLLDGAYDGVGEGCAAGLSIPCSGTVPGSVV